MLKLLIFSIFVLKFESKGIYIVEERDGKTYTQAVSDPTSTEKIGEQIRKLFDFDFEKSEGYQKISKISGVSEFMRNLYKELENEEIHQDPDEDDDEDEDFEKATWQNADRILTTQLSEEVSPRKKSGAKNFALKFSRGRDDVASKIVKAELRAEILRSKIVADTFWVVFDTEGISPKKHQITPENPRIVADVIDFWTMSAASSNPTISFTLVTSSEPEADDVTNDDVAQELEIDAFIVVGVKDVQAAAGPKRRSRRAVTASPLNVPQRVRRSKSAYFEKPEKNEICQKKGLYVDFDALGWKKWVIAPEGFSAFYCSGACSVPFDKSMNVSAHAIVQSMINLVRPNITSEAKCVPSKLSSMKILLEDHKKDMQIKRYHDMVVQECGCH